MSKLIVLALGLMVHFSSLTQTDTIQLSIVRSKIFRCTNEGAKNWVMYTDDNDFFYLSRLTLDNSELKAWFEKYKDSQNIYKAQKSLFSSHSVLFFRKLDQIDDQIKFIVVAENENEMTLTSEEIQEVFIFKLID
ncbi:MAG: hypothetical protein KJ941_09095 [Bacteroidetes bacterium]|nr:hypothetical protein [Bacteroidota bacterium]